MPTSRRHTRPWVDDSVALDRAIEEQAQEVAALEDQLQHARARLERLRQYQPEPETPRGDRDLPGHDRRIFGAGDGPAVAS